MCSFKLNSFKMNLLVFAFLWLVLATPVAFGQLTGDLQVNVADATNAAIRNATVEVRNLDTGATRTSTSDITGSARINQLGIGRYEVKVSHERFATAASETAVVGGTSTTVPVTLTVAASSQRVEVTER